MLANAITVFECAPDPLRVRHTDYGPERMQLNCLIITPRCVIVFACFRKPPTQALIDRSLPTRERRDNVGIQLSLTV